MGSLSLASIECIEFIVKLSSLFLILPIFLDSSSSISRRGTEGCPEHYQKELGKAASRLILVWTPFWHQWGAWRSILDAKTRFRDQGCPVWRYAPLGTGME